MLFALADMPQNPNQMKATDFLTRFDGYLHSMHAEFLELVKDGGSVSFDGGKGTVSQMFDRIERTAKARMDAGVPPLFNSDSWSNYFGDFTYPFGKDPKYWPCLEALIRQFSDTRLAGGKYASTPASVDEIKEFARYFGRGQLIKEYMTNEFLYRTNKIYKLDTMVRGDATNTSVRSRVFEEIHQVLYKKDSMLEAYAQALDPVEPTSFAGKPDSDIILHIKRTPFWYAYCAVDEIPRLCAVYLQNLQDAFLSGESPTLFNRGIILRFGDIQRILSVFHDQDPRDLSVALLMKRHDTSGKEDAGVEAPDVDYLRIKEYFPTPEDRANIPSMFAFREKLGLSTNSKITPSSTDHLATLFMEDMREMPTGTLEQFILQNLGFFWVERANGPRGTIVRYIRSKEDELPGFLDAAYAAARIRTDDPSYAPSSCAEVPPPTKDRYYNMMRGDLSMFDISHGGK